MKTRKFLAISVLATAGTAAAPAMAQAASDEVTRLITPVSSVEIGVIGALDQTNTVGMYSGLNEMDAFPIANGRFITRDNETGTWFRVEGNNLGLSSRDARIEYERQGGWKVWLEYDQKTKSNPLEITSGLAGIGGNQQFVNGTAMRDVELDIDRYKGALGISKRFGRNFLVEVSYSGEKKEGDRPFSVRAGGSTILFFTDPVDYWHHETTAALSYNTQRLQLTGGALVSLFTNNHKALVNSSAMSPISLPSDNEAYKVYINGAYKITPTTQATMKFSYNFMSQDEDFFTPPTFAGNTETDLGGKVHNYLGQLAVSSRPIPKLHLRAKVRYEGRRDSTDQSQYLTPSATRSGVNVTFNRDTINVDGEASYQLPWDLRVTGFVGYEGWDRTFPPARQVSWREDTDEYSGGVRLRKTFTQDLDAEIGYSYASRDGSSWVPPGRVPGPGLLPNLVDPIHWADRDRHQVKFSADWTPTNALSLQARIDGTLDAYNGLVLGPRDGRSINAAIDANLQVSRDWSVSAWVSRNEVFRDQATFGSGQFWQAEMTQTGYSGGLGVRGTAMEDLSVGADAQYSHDKNEYDLDPISGAVIADLADITYQRFDLNLWAEYKLSDRGSLKAGYGFAWLKNDDFTYDAWIFADGTVIRIPERETAHFVGVSYRYQW